MSDPEEANKMGHGDTGTAPHAHVTSAIRQLYLQGFPRIADSRASAGGHLERARARKLTCAVGKNKIK